MKKKYNPKTIEAKWQKQWEKSGIYKAKDFSDKPKWYSLIEFPYPSGEGLHTGHIRSNTAMDIISRKRRMEGFNVLYPIGWDAFGLPTENYAIKTGIHPIKVTKKNTDTFRKQLKSVGFSFDWDREINTSDPAYYKWTQWIFLELFKKGLAYKQKSLINWCPKDKIGLANEEVVNGHCERCGTEVIKKEKEQWMLAITKYAERLDKDLDKVDYLPQIKLQQRNWIGRSEGAEINYKLKIKNEKFGIEIPVFTTRPDTLFGVTYIVLAPEHQAVAELLNKVGNRKEVEDYIKKTQKETETDRTAENKEKTGIKLDGVLAINPVNNEEVPVFIADYVLATYGTGAVMAVPAHDERDFAFAKKYDLPIRQVIMPHVIDQEHLPRKDKENTRRTVIHAMVKHPTEEKFIVLKWKKFPWRTFITGGVEEDEDIIAAAKREVLEETGFKNLRYVKRLPWVVFSEFYAEHKDVNRAINANFLYFELENEEMDEISPDEAAIHEVEWLDFAKMGELSPVSELEHVLEWWNNGEKAFTDYGVLINSGKFDDRKSEDVMKDITEFAGGKWVTKFKLRDWVFSRQRYWGEPIPLVYCPSCAKATAGEANAGWVPVPEKDLPVVLPNVKEYQPSDDGESPLSRVPKWVNTKCPVCGGPGKRETDTMPNWAGSSWYFLRYIDPENNKELASLDKLKYWGGTGLPRSDRDELKTLTWSATGVDWYNGGAEHITLHLLYSRFWTKFLYDIGVVPFDEPYQKRTLHGMILGEGGVKMSKSKGNVVNPDQTVKLYGADTLRIYEMFMGPFDQSIAWSTESIIGSRRFLDKIWNISQKTSKNAQNDNSLEALTHRTIKKVGEDIEQMAFNTAISTMMVWANEADKSEAVSADLFELVLKVLAPFAPHMAEEIWSQFGHKKSIHLELWPKPDEQKMAEDKVNLVIQINGKVRDSVIVDAKADVKDIENIVLDREFVKKWIDNQDIKRIIHVKGRLVNIVV